MSIKNYSYLAAALLMIAGCHSPKETSASAAQRAKMTESDVKFETSEDPPLKAKTRFAAGQLIQRVERDIAEAGVAHS